MTINTSISGPAIPAPQPAPYAGEFDPLLARLWAVIDHYAYRAGVDRAVAAVQLANARMPR